jgi:hypothetical protein
MFGLSRRARRSADRACSESSPAIAEALEPRLLLSAVSVTYAASQITVKGDSLGDAIAVSVANGHYSVTGSNGTTITTKGTAPSNSANVSLNISLGDGGNSVTMDGLKARNVTVVTGKGADAVSIGGVSEVIIAGSIDVNTGAGADTVALSNGTYIGNVKIATGAGDDIVQFGYAGGAAALAYFAGSVSVDTGDGANTIDASTEATGSPVQFDKAVAFKMGKGNDILSMATGAATNQVLFSGNTTFDLGDGDDQFNVDRDGVGDTAEFNGPTNKFLFGAGANSVYGAGHASAMHFGSSASTSVTAKKGSLSSGLRSFFFDSVFDTSGDLYIQW